MRWYSWFLACLLCTPALAVAAEAPPEGPAWEEPDPEEAEKRAPTKKKAKKEKRPPARSPATKPAPKTRSSKTERDRPSKSPDKRPPVRRDRERPAKDAPADQQPRSGTDDSSRRRQLPKYEPRVEPRVEPKGQPTTRMEPVPRNQRLQTPTKRRPVADDFSRAEPAVSERSEGSQPSERSEEAASRRRPRPRGVRDGRYARPHHRHVVHHHHVHYGPPIQPWYRPWYSHWWLHPYFRWTHATLGMVWFHHEVLVWQAGWTPPPRSGWVWVAGAWNGPYWVPGHWVPVAPPPARYVYVPGFWLGSVYVEGFWRVERRSGDWVWVRGRYRDDNSRSWGHWAPTTPSPAGYTWVKGFWDGEAWVAGFWRPEYRAGYRWVQGWFADTGVFHAGYWEPIDELPGSIWVPGWFDGQSWIPGYWVSEEEYRGADPVGWEGGEGFDAGWDAPAAPSDEEPLALPVAPE